MKTINETAAKPKPPSNNKTAANPHNQNLTLCIEGMHCAGCTGRVENALKTISGVNEVAVNLNEGIAVIKGTNLNTSDLINIVKQRGFDAQPLSKKQSVQQQRTALETRQHENSRKWRNRSIVGFAAWIPMAIIHWAGRPLGLYTSMHPDGIWLILMTVLAAVVLLYVGTGFYTSAYKAAKNRSTNMDTLVSIGATAAFGFSIVVLIMLLAEKMHWITGPINQPLYFGESAGLLAIISLGHYLEAKSTAVAGSAVKDLLALQPDEVCLLKNQNDTTGTKIPSAKIKPQDLMLILPGQRIAVDGIITNGQTSIDESVVTGESLPVERNINDIVIAGAMNLTGRIVVSANTDGYNTTISRIADMVRNAQASKANIQRLADKVSSIFVPTVLAIALLTFVGWGIAGYFIETSADNGLQMSHWVYAVIYATTVLVISCPCALGLATPAAVMVGSGAASRHGILVKSAQALERAAVINVIMFDKTGTLTEGAPAIVAPESLDDDLIKNAAAIASASNHPLSKAIVNEAAKRKLQLPVASDIKETAGTGITGNVNNQPIEIISLSTALKSENLKPAVNQLISSNNHIQNEIDTNTASVVIYNHKPIGIIRFQDKIRNDAPQLITLLQNDGIRPVLLTGDRQTVAEAVCKQVGINPADVKSQLTPIDKVNHVKAEISRGSIVAMVGDGINDAAALAEAGAAGGIGVAMGTGTNIAIESADVVIPAERLAAIHELIIISRNSLRTIKQNLFLSFIYNILAIPAAALGLFGINGPLIAAAAMGLSDFSVIGNAIRLKIKLKKILGG